MRGDLAYQCAWRPGCPRGRAIANTRTAHKTKRTATVSRTAQLGISTVEYALLAVGVIAIVGVLIVLLEGGILGLLDQVSGRMTAAATQ